MTLITGPYVTFGNVKKEAVPGSSCLEMCTDMETQERIRRGKSLPLLRTL